MAIRIQLRHDLSTNWATNNPILYPGEFGIELDTGKIKVGPTVTAPTLGTAWNDITDYINIVPSDFDGIITGYIQLSAIGSANGVAGLNNYKDLLIPGSSIIIEGSSNDEYKTTLTVTNPQENRTITFPDASGTVALLSDVADAFSNLVDGAPGLLDTLNELAAAINDDPTFFTSVATNLSNHESDTTNVHGIVNTADLATKTYADDAADAAQTAANGYTDAAIGQEVTDRNTAITTAINALSTSDIEEGTNLYYTDDRAKAEAANLLTNATKNNIQITKDGSNNLTITAENGVADSTTTDLAEGTNKYFTNERAQDAVGQSLGTGLSYDDPSGSIYVTPNTYDAYGDAAAVASDLSSHASNTHTHGTTSDIVGVSDNQVLTNKTIDTVNNTIKINGNNIESYTGSGDQVVLSSSPSISVGINFNGSSSGQTTVKANSVAAGTLTLPVVDGTIALESYVDTSISTHSADTTNIHGIADTSALATKTYADNAAGAAQTAAAGYTDTAISNLVDGAPNLLNTLNELAAAINDDASIADTLTSAIGEKVSKSGDTMTGALTLPSDPVSNLQAATKQYVDATAETAQNNAEDYADSLAVNYDINGAADAAETAANLYTDGAISTEVTNRNSAIDTAKGEAISSSNGYTDGEIVTALSTAQGYADAAEQDAKDYADGLAGNYDAAGAALTAEGNANNYTDGKISTEVSDRNTAISTAINALTTSDIEEGSNKYFTDERAQDAVGNSVGAGLKYTDSQGSIEPDLGISGGLYIDPNGKLSADGYYVTFNSAEQTLTNKTLTSPKINENVVLTATATELNTLDGITASTSELNILDGATLSTTELNYVDGVTSSIQTQIDSKAPIVNPEFTSNVTVDGNLTVNGAITTVDSVQIDTAATTTPAVGKITWDSTNGTAQLGLVGGNVNLQIGQEQVVYVYNDDSVTLTEGMLVYPSGAHGDRISVKRASNTSHDQAFTTIGMVTEPISVGGTGFVTTSGEVHGLNLTGYTAGQKLWLGIDGAFTNVEPTQPAHQTFVGIVERANGGNGIILVALRHGLGLEDLNSVNISSAANHDLIAYDSATQTWKNTNNIEINNLTIDGTLTFNGTATTINSTNTELTDSMLYLASEQYDTDVVDIGIYAAYGDSNPGHKHTGFFRDATDGKWKLISNGTEPTGNVVDLTGVTYDTLKIGTLEGNVTGNVTGNLTGDVTGNVSGNAGSVTNGVYTTDTGTVTSTMIANGTIVNADINASAAIDATKISGTAVTQADTGTVTNTMLAGSIANNKLANSTISGIALGSNLASLTIGTGLSGTSYNGSGAVTIAIDSSVVTLNGAQSLANKTLKGPVYLQSGGGAGGSNNYIDVSNATGVVSLTSGYGISLTSTGNITLSPTGSAKVGSDVITTNTATQTLTGKTISGSDNTLSNIGNSSLTNSKVTVGTTDISLGSAATTLTGLSSVTSTAFVGTLTGNASTVTNGVYTTDTGTVTNTMLAGSIANAKLLNSKITVGTTDINLGSSATTLAGLSSITSTLFTGNLTGDVTGNVSGNAGTVTNGVYVTDTGTVTNTMLAGSIANNKLTHSSITINGSAISLGDSISGLATLASPAFTGNPTAPTQSAGDNSTKIATTAYADSAAASAAAAIVASAPSTLDTLNELATALGNDANYATTITTALGNKQDKVTGVSDTEIGYLDGVTSAIQTQLDDKAIYPSQSGNGSKYLQTDGTTTSWQYTPIEVSDELNINLNTTTIIDSVAMNVGTVEYVISIVQGIKVRSSKVLVQNDGTNINMTEYAIMEMNGEISGVEISTTPGYLNIIITDAETTNATVKFRKIAL